MIELIQLKMLNKGIAAHLYMVCNTKSECKSCYAESKEEFLRGNLQAA